MSYVDSIASLAEQLTLFEYPALASNYHEQAIRTAQEAQTLREFESGATRSAEADKHDYEGFMSPLVVCRFGEYMHKHRTQPDGQLRDSDNWQLGIPKASYMKSGWRHFMDWWLAHRGFKPNELLEEALCALIFNANGYLHNLLVEREYRK